MALLVAAVLAGVPAEISLDVLKAVREKFPDQVVLRAVGARTYETKFAVYDRTYCDSVLDQAVDAIFGQSDRPKSFCRHPAKSCVEVSANKKNCGGGPDLACGRRKPDRFLLFYQASADGGADELISMMAHSARIIPIPRERYNDLDRTVDFIVGAIASVSASTEVVASNIASGAPSILLPPLNFDRKELRRLLKAGVVNSLTKASLKAFRSAYFKADKYFLGRARLAFEPTNAATSHGIVGVVSERSRALASHYRAGCSYPGDFHWDVSPKGERGKSAGWGDTKIYCPIEGAQAPKGKHANVLVTDGQR